MKKTLLTVMLSVVTHFGLHSQNLLLNGDAEMPLVGDSIPHWKQTIGNDWTASSFDEIGSPTPTSGPNFFYPGFGSQQFENNMVSEIEQEIDITADAESVDTGMKNYYFNGYTRSFSQSPADQSNFFIQFYDENESLLQSFNLGSFSSVDFWTNTNTVLRAPAESRKIKVKLHSVLLNGSSNDGNYDDLYLGHAPFLGIAESRTASFIIYPNPSNGIFNIQSDLLLGNSDITISDLNGRIVHQEKSESKVLNLQKIQSGIYVVKITNNDMTYSQKIIKN